MSKQPAIHKCEACNGPLKSGVERRKRTAFGLCLHYINKHPNLIQQTALMQRWSEEIVLFNAAFAARGDGEQE